MSSITYEELARKFELLPDQAKKEAFDFVEFLFQKTRPNRKKVDKKKILLGMSCWTDQDIQELDRVREHMNQWQPETF